MNPLIRPIFTSPLRYRTSAMSHAPQYFNAEEVTKTLTWPLVNAAVAEALRSTPQSEPDAEHPEGSYSSQPPRGLTICGDRSRILFSMPGFVGNYKLNDRRRDTLACKLVTSFTGNAQRSPPLPNILATILLFSHETGALECIMDGTQITAWRTASASVVATKYLYFRRFAEGNEKDRRIKVAIIGCGVQGQSHALGMCGTFNVSDIYLWNRTASKAHALSDLLRKEHENVNVCVTESVAEAVAEADVICVGTYSPTALVDHAMLKKSQVHINTVGAGKVHFGEVAQDIYDKSKVYVDSMPAARVELKDLKADIVGEVGEIMRNCKYPSQDGITIFQSMGMAAEDATVAQAIFEKLRTERKQ